MVKGEKFMRVGPRFNSMRNNLRAELPAIVGRRVSDRELTDGIASFLEEERLLPIIKRRAARGRRGLF